MGKRIKLTEDMMIEKEKSKSFFGWKFRMFKNLLILLLFLIISSYTTLGLNMMKEYFSEKYAYAKSDLYEKFKLIEYQTKIVPIDEAELSDIVKKYSKKYGINVAVTWALINKESGMKHDRVRYEPSWEKIYSKKYPKKKWMNDIEYQLQFSSFGLTQVSYIIWKDFCHLNSYADLFSREVALNCSLKIMRKCLNDNKNIFPKGKRLKLCFKQYNGNGKKADRYASDMMERLANYMVNDTNVIIKDEIKLTKSKTHKTIIRNIK